MSRTTLRGNQPRYRLRVGVETQLPQPSLYGCVLDLGERPETHVLAPLGKTLDADVLVKVGASIPPLRDVQEVVSALAPYGSVPLPLQLTLLEELDALAPFAIFALGKQLAAICQHASDAHLTLVPDDQEEVFLLLTEQGWQMQPWQRLTSPTDASLAQILFPDQQVSLEPVAGYLSQPSLFCFVHELGMRHRLPVYALFARGVALSGPVLIASEGTGLIARHVDVVRHEVFFVTQALRPQVSALWYRAWRTGAGRGW
jgi:hypothetical protein